MKASGRRAQLAAQTSGSKGSGPPARKRAAQTTPLLARQTADGTEDDPGLTSHKAAVNRVAEGAEAHTQAQGRAQPSYRRGCAGKRRASPLAEGAEDRNAQRCHLSLSAITAHTAVGSAAAKRCHRPSCYARGVAAASARRARAAFAHASTASATASGAAAGDRALTSKRLAGVTWRKGWLAGTARGLVLVRRAERGQLACAVPHPSRGK